MNKSIPWPSSPDQIDPAMLDDIANRIASAPQGDKKTSKQAILKIINHKVKEHYK